MREKVNNGWSAIQYDRRRRGRQRRRHTQLPSACPPVEPTNQRTSYSYSPTLHPLLAFFFLYSTLLMAPLSLFRLRKQLHHHHQQQQQRRVVEPISPASFFSPGGSRSPSIDDAADIVLELEAEPAPEPPEQLERSVTDEEREREAPSVPVSASASASASAISFVHSTTPGPPTLALSLRFSFDAEGSLGDSIQRYFLSSHPDIHPDNSRAGRSTPEPTTIVPAVPTVPAVPAVVTFRPRGASTSTRTSTTSITNNVNNIRINSTRNPTVSIHRLPGNFVIF